MRRAFAGIIGAFVCSATAELQIGDEVRTTAVLPALAMVSVLVPLGLTRKLQLRALSLFQMNATLEEGRSNTATWTATARDGRESAKGWTATRAGQLYLRRFAVFVLRGRANVTRATVEVDRRPHEVFAYVTDPTGFAEWQNGVVDGHMEAAGTPAVGAKCLTTRRIGLAKRVDPRHRRRHR